jgi:excinuclease ABC subunit A
MKKNNEYISCSGVRTHNLKNIDVKIPLKKWVSITGVSGSGKSSFAFDTLYSESQRRFIETLGTYERQFLNGLPQGEFDKIDNLPAAIALKQTNRTGDPRSVIATAADLAEPLKTIFISLMEPSCANCGSPVISHHSSELYNFFCNHKKQKQNKTFIISVPYKILDNNKIENLTVEGYTRLLIEDEIHSIEELYINKNKFNYPLECEIILDRINSLTDDNEILNRVETIWSQVKFSPKFTFIKICEIFNSKKILTDEITLYVQPFCKKCNQNTSIIQSNDLDWQSALGACKKCNGLGNIPILDEAKIIPNQNLTLKNGAIKPWTSDTFSWINTELLNECKKRNININTSYTLLSDENKNLIWNGEKNAKKQKNELISINSFFETLEQERYKSTSRILLAKYRKYITCPECNGARLGKSGRNAICNNKTYHEIFQLEIKDTLTWLQSLEGEKKFHKRLNSISEIYKESFNKLTLLNKLGLGSAQLFRRCKTLSGGEYQRVLLTRVIGNGLTDALYVLDEPSVGLGKTEIPALISCIKELRDLGNTVIIVDHDKDLVTESDIIIEFGPEGGENGGKIIPLVNNMPQSFITKFSSYSDKKFKKEPIEKSRFFLKEKSIFIKNFSALYFDKVDIEIVTEKLNVITGPSGSGKSTLIRYGIEAAIEKYKEYNTHSNEIFDIDSKIGVWDSFEFPKEFFQFTELISVEQKALHRTSTSVPATVLGIMDALRKYFALSNESKKLGFNSSDFSFNGAGGCNTCNGKGVIQEDLFFLGEVEKICPDCNGQRYRSDVLKVKWLGKNIYTWLTTSLHECLESFAKYPEFQKPLNLACELGLGHIPLGFTTTSMSGGEAQRLRIAAALVKSSKKLFCILDEPTRGLSEKDVERLISSLLLRCKDGHTFVIAEHHEMFQAFSDHLIKLGPGSGSSGSKIVSRAFTVSNL